jgi:hypothetical protein
VLDQQSLAPLNGDRHEKMLVTAAVAIVHREKTACRARQTVD